jgi:hypothetical protein
MTTISFLNRFLIFNKEKQFLPFYWAQFLSVVTFAAAVDGTQDCVQFFTTLAKTAKTQKTLFR